MYEVNRSVALLRPKAPFIDWLESLPGDVDGLPSLDELRGDCNALLIPAADDYASAEDFVRVHYRALFAAELADWCDDEALWPAPLTQPLFTEWFEVEIHSVLTDLVDAALEREPFIPLDMGEPRGG
ncbi:VacJ [Crenobacter cavernae]|uniref:VacJ n=1 Tax=Crenobacter cavernae TaxID=2290923 RepID=A0A345Y3X1_9NEIS|nr:VacJ [Crenobacter cavernae]AXK38623.1 VacJ [Crenobacter cavernae]